MSTDLTPRSRRASRRSDVTASQASSLSSFPVGPTRKSRGRPSLGEMSTASSASSKLSNVFDEEMSTSSRSGSPTTPSCDTSPQPREKITPKICPIPQNLDNSPHSEPKPRRKRAQGDETPSKSPESTNTSVRASQKHASSRKSAPLIDREPGPPALGYHLTPKNNVTGHQRASSAPTIPLRREESLDVDRLQLPGRYESQSSNFDAEINYETEQLPPLIVLNQNEGKDGDGQSTASEAHEDDDEVDDESYLASGTGTSVQHQFVTYDIEEPPPSPFIPYTSIKGRPTVRRVRGRLSINEDILNLIQEKQKKGKKRGWVYITESAEYGPEKLKIGMSRGTPDKRIEKLQECGLELKEILSKQMNPFYYFPFVEKVVHLHLGDQRLKLRCQNLSYQKQGGKVRWHVEWFEIDRKTALSVVETWRNWVLIQEPFDSEGRLTPYWRWRAERLGASIANPKWEEWTQPPKWCYHVFLIKSHFARTRKDVYFYITSAVVTLLSFVGHGSKGAIWAVIFLLFL